MHVTKLLNDPLNVTGRFSEFFFREMSASRYRHCISAMLSAFFATGALDSLEGNRDAARDSEFERLHAAVLVHWDSLSDAKRSEWLALADMDVFPQPAQVEAYVPPPERMCLLVVSHLHACLLPPSVNADSFNLAPLAKIQRSMKAVASGGMFIVTSAICFN